MGTERPGWTRAMANGRQIRCWHYRPDPNADAAAVVENRTWNAYTFRPDLGVGRRDHIGRYATKLKAMKAVEELHGPAATTER